MTITKAGSFSDIYSISNQTVFTESKKVSSDITYHDGTGYHIYTQLSLTNTLTNPTDVKASEYLFEVIQKYADLVACCLKNTTGKIIEVQGERLHIFFPYELNYQTASDVATFCAAITNAVYDKKFRLGNTHFKGFKICLDYGRAVILKTGIDADDSLISLGPCANAPAKHLPDVQAEYTAFSTSIAKLIFSDVDGRKTWYEINLHDRKILPTIIAQQSLDSILASASSFNPVYQAGRFTVSAGGSFVPGNNLLPQAVFVQGLFMRADLDGFTLRVKNAFDNGNVTELIQDFCQVIKYGDDFINKAARPIIRVPWAGDCANMVVLPKSTERIKDTKFFYPAMGAHDWLSRYDGKIPEPYQNTAWLVSICAGNSSTGNCQILVAPVETDGHKFLFAAGWSVGRSLDAQEQDGLRPDESVISKEDYDDMEITYKEHYSMLNTVFAHSSSIKATKNFTQTVIPSLMAKSHRVTGSISNAIPQPRPHWG